MNQFSSEQNYGILAENVMSSFQMAAPAVPMHAITNAVVVEYDPGAFRLCLGEPLRIFLAKKSFDGKWHVMFKGIKKVSPMLSSAVNAALAEGEGVQVTTMAAVSDFHDMKGQGAHA